MVATIVVNSVSMHCSPHPEPHADPYVRNQVDLSQHHH